MDSIKSYIGLSPHMGTVEHLSIYINDKRLDDILSKIDESFIGLIPAWLNYYDKDFPPSAKERNYVWEQTRPSNKPTILPILLCPDDFDFSCTVIVVEVIWNDDVVIWNRFGTDITPFDKEEVKLPKYIGKSVKWFQEIGPFSFSKLEYLQCISKFEML